MYDDWDFYHHELIIKRHIFLMYCDPTNIQFIQNPDIRVQLAAVKTKPDSIRYIKSPAPDVQMYVVKRDISLLALIDNPCTAAIEYCNQQKKSKSLGYIIRNFFYQRRH